MTRPGYTLDRDDDGFTAREREVRDLSATGLSTRKIGERLGITHTRVAAILRAIRERQTPQGE